MFWAAFPPLNFSFFAEKIVMGAAGACASISKKSLQFRLDAEKPACPL
jgi:hypothetical protein